MQLDLLVCQFILVALKFEYFKMTVSSVKLVFFTKERLRLLGSCGFVMFKVRC